MIVQVEVALFVAFCNAEFVAELCELVVVWLTLAIKGTLTVTVVDLYEFWLLAFAWS